MSSTPLLLVELLSPEVASSTIGGDVRVIGSLYHMFVLRVIGGWFGRCY